MFAPNDDAFVALAKKLGKTKMELLDLPNLADVLKFHVVSGRVMSTDLKEGMEAKTLAGKSVTITLSGGPKVNGAKIKKADVKCTNGVIHLIDAVLLP